MGKIKDQIIVSESIKLYENTFRFIYVQTSFLTQFSKIAQKLVIVRSLIFCNYLELMIFISYKEMNTWE